VRLEYVVIGFILAAAVLVIALSMLSGVVPGVEEMFDLFRGA